MTAANASTLNDGASAMLLMSRAKAASLGLKPLALIRSYADAEQAPIDFSTSPALALPKAYGTPPLTTTPHLRIDNFSCAGTRAPA